MSEKRFQKGMNLSCVDTETGKSYWYACNLCSLLNELVTKCHSLEKENKELNSIKKFAEKNGINIFLIDEAFRKCWKDNEKLFEENEQLKEEIEPLKQKEEVLNKIWRTYLEHHE